MLIKDGTYPGNGTSQTIDCGFAPKVVIVKGDGAYQPVIKIDTMAATQSTVFNTATTYNTSQITAFTATGFTVAGGTVNTDLATYYWVALGADEWNDLATFTYTGTGASNPITGIGFKPDYVFTKGNCAQIACNRYVTQAATYSYVYTTTSAAITTGITSFDSDGFTVSTSLTVNESGSTYCGWAVKAGARAVVVDTYTGTGSDNKDITLTSLLIPKLVLTQTSKDAEYPCGRFGSTGDESGQMWDLAWAADRIQSMTLGYFQVGTNSSVNGAGYGTSYLAIGAPKQTPGTGLTTFISADVEVTGRTRGFAAPEAGLLSFLGGDGTYQGYSRPVTVKTPVAGVLHYFGGDVSSAEFDWSAIADSVARYEIQ